MQAAYYREAKLLPNNHFTATDFYLSGKKQMTGTFLGKNYKTDTGKEDGYFTFYDSIGHKSYEGKYANGKQTGKWTYYYEGSDKIFFTKSFVESPNYYVFYDSITQKKRAEGHEHVEDKAPVNEGTWKYYYPKSGKLSNVLHYKNGKVNGKAVYYAENGQIETEGILVNNRALGNWALTIRGENAAERFFLIFTRIFAAKSIVYKKYNSSGKLLSTLRTDGIENITKENYDAKGHATKEQMDILSAHRPPTAGFELTDYIKANLKYPADALKTQVEGDVHLTFLVTTSGEIKVIRVVKSLNASCDKEAIRLIKEMPRWQPGTFFGDPLEEPANCTVTFEMPK